MWTGFVCVWLSLLAKSLDLFACGFVCSLVRTVSWAPLCLAIRSHLVVSSLAPLVHSFKDSWLLLFLNSRRPSSLLYLQLLSPLVQIFPYHNKHLPIVSLVCYYMEIIFQFGLACFLSFLGERVKLDEFWVITLSRPLLIPHTIVLY